jgi:hypothetical protein
VAGRDVAVASGVALLAAVSWGVVGAAAVAVAVAAGSGVSVGADVGAKPTDVSISSAALLQADSKDGSRRSKASTT